MRLLGKIILSGKIENMTGLAIGGSSDNVGIGGIDTNVIKNSKGIPYIPGSSIKGKIRSLLELSLFDEIEKDNNNMCKCGKLECPICTVFGVGANQRTNAIGPTRLIIRDAYLSEETTKEMINKNGKFSDLELIYTEGKWENSIDRLNSTANPRQIERVPAGAKFDFEFVYNVFSEKDLLHFNEFLKGLKLLENDALGGNGSRGYGRIKFLDITASYRAMEYYLDIVEELNEEIANLEDFVLRDSEIYSLISKNFKDN